MNSSTPASVISFWNREELKIQDELVYGDSLIRWAYQNPVGSWVTRNLLVKPWISQVFGDYQNTSRSTRKIPSFIDQYQIDMSQFESGPFATFNDFFIRRFQPGKRVFESSPSKLAAFAEGRYFAHARVTSELMIPVKGQHLSAAALLGEEATQKWNSTFEGGPLLIARLCPVDYHRFHFPADGKTLDFFKVAGQLHSVNPIALKNYPQVFAINERQVSILETQNFGKLAYIEVGAMMVGKIVQTHSSPTFLRGQEKGYFLFGASTVILLGEPGRWTPDADLLKNTSQGIETLVKLGQPLAVAAATPN